MLIFSHWNYFSRAHGRPVLILKFLWNVYNYFFHFLCVTFVFIFLIYIYIYWLFSHDCEYQEIFMLIWTFKKVVLYECLDLLRQLIFLNSLVVDKEKHKNSHGMHMVENCMNTRVMSPYCARWPSSEDAQAGHQRELVCLYSMFLSGSTGVLLMALEARTM